MKTNMIWSALLSTLRKMCSRSAMLFVVIFYTGAVYSQNWSSLAGGMNGYVYATAIYNGQLIAGGLFNQAAGTTANNIAKWNGSTWEVLGSGLNGRVDALTVYNGELIAGGQFTASGGLAMNFIAAWNGTEWSDHLGVMGDKVAALTVYGTDLIAAGNFTLANGTQANYIAKYNNTGGWSALGSGMGGSQGKVAALTVHQGELIAGGFFTTAGGVPADHIAKWNGSTWSALGSGISDVVYSLAGYNNNLIAGGLFLSAGGTPANNIASWDGSSWSPLGSGIAGVPYQFVLSLHVYYTNLIVGGLFTTAGGIAVKGIAKWDGSGWSGLNGGVWMNDPLSASGVYTMSVSGSDLIAGGIFNNAGTLFDVGNIAAWNEPAVPALLFIQNDSVDSGINKCYNATQTITVAGNGTSFVVKNGGIATMIAGENIVYLPGTKVDAGGYLLGYITTTAQYCGNTKTPQMVTKPIQKVENEKIIRTQ